MRAPHGGRGPGTARASSAGGTGSGCSRDRRASAAPGFGAAARRALRPCGEPGLRSARNHAHTTGRGPMGGAESLGGVSWGGAGVLGAGPARGRGRRFWTLGLWDGFLEDCKQNSAWFVQWGD